MNPKLFTTSTVGVLLASLALAGCGTKTDPTSDYQDLNASVPAYTGQQDAQSVLPASVFRAEMPGNMNFVEGQEASYPVTVSTQLHDISFALTATGLPSGVSLVQIDGIHYAIKGTVPVGTSTGLQHGEKAPVTISAVNVKGDQTEVHMFNSLLHTWSPTVTIFATDKEPMVEAQALGLSVNEGDTLPISIIVDDIGSHGSQMPSIQSPFQDDMQNGEVSFVSAMPGLRMSRTPVALGGGKFKFSGSLNTKLLSLPAGKKDVTARFVVNFKSPSGLISADEIIDVKVVRSAAAVPVAVPMAPAAAAAAAAPAAPAKAAAKPVKKKKKKASAASEKPAAPAVAAPAAKPDAASSEAHT